MNYPTDQFTDELKNHVGFKYMMDILEERIISCKETKWGCLRQYNDLLTGHERGLYFSQETADMVMDVMREYKHFKGDFAGQNFEPTPPQVFWNWCLFGWLKEDGTRRYSEAYKCVARKNGKSYESAATGTYMFEADGEPGAECYTVANKLMQARIVHENVKAIVKETPEVFEKTKVLRDNLSITSTYSKFEPLGRDSKTEDGLNPHFVSYDEFHAAPDNAMYEVIDSAFGGRSQPLFFIITTAGVNPQGPCYKHQEYCVKVLDPKLPEITNDALFVMIYTLDEGDDPFDESVWEKANPNMPYIPTIYIKLKAAANKAKEKPTDLVNFKTKHMNIWCSSSTPWLDMDKWYLSDGTFGDRDLVNKKCFSGLDLATVNDLAALVHLFPPEQESIAKQRSKFRDIIISEIKKANNKLTPQALVFLLDDKADEIETDLRKKDYIVPDPYRIIPHFFVPEENILERSKNHGVNYDLWVKDKSCNFHATPGEVVDYDFIEYQIDKDNTLFDIQEIDFDPHNAIAITNNLMDKGYECVEIAQTWKNFSWVTKEFEQLVNLALLAHNNNPVLSWNASNVVVHIGPTTNYKPDKKNSKEKIDGIIALLMALNRSITVEEVLKCQGNDGSLI